MNPYSKNPGFRQKFCLKKLRKTHFLKKVQIAQKVAKSGYFDNF